MTGGGRHRELPDAPTAREWAEALLLRRRMAAAEDGAPDAGTADGRHPDPPDGPTGDADGTRPPAGEPGAADDPPPPPGGTERGPGEDPGGRERAGAPAWLPRTPPPGRTGWDAAHAPEPGAGQDPGSGDRAVRPPDHPGLRDTLALNRALRPLDRRWHQPHARALDEEATAVRSVQLGRWAPVLAEVRGDWLDVALVVEHSPSMLLWRDVGRALAELLDRQGAFRDVRVWRLDTWASKEAVLYSEQGATAHDPAELLHPEGRRLVLVLSDCVADAWAGGAAPRILTTWARQQPVAVLNPLPSRLWQDTDAVPVDLRLRASAGGEPNARLGMRGGLPTTAPRTGAAPVPVPVLEIDPVWLNGWARMVGGVSSGWTPASALLVDEDGLRTPWPVERRETAAPATPAELVRRFVTGASPAAQRLATRLAMVPLTLAVMQAERTSLLPEAGPLPLAEIMLGGLLQQVGPAPSAGDRTGERPPAFEFIDGVRAHLLGGLGRTEIFRALPIASAVAAKALGARDDLAGRLLRTPQQVHSAGLSSPERHLVGAMQHALSALGAAYAPMAERARIVAGDTATERNPDVDRTPGQPFPPDPAPHLPQNLTPDPTTPPGDPRVLSADGGTATPTAAAAGGDITAQTPPPQTPPPQTPPPQAPPVRSATEQGPPSDGRGQIAPDLSFSLVAGSSHSGEFGPGAGAPAGPQGSSSSSSTGEMPDPGRVPRPGAYFTGREDELRQLRSALSEGVRAALLPQALYGLGGVGKTQLALEYVRRYAGDYDLVWWVQAEQPAVIRNSLAALAPRLGVRDADAQTVIDRVIGALESGKPVKRWLLVFDNAGAPSAVERFLPYMAGVQGGIGHVIVTSRNAGWADSVPSLRIDVFPRGESLAFLRRRDPGISDAEATRMAVALGDLPLALEQAAAMKVKSGLTTDEFLELLETQGERVRGEAASNAPGTKPVAAVWQVSMRDLQDRNPGALELLRLLAFFGPDPVQLSFLHDARLLRFPEPLASLLRDPIARSRAIAETGRYSLLTTDVGTAQVHRVLRNVLQDELSAEERAEMRSRVHQTLVAHDPGEPQLASNWERYRDLLPHIRPSGMIESDDQEVRWTVLNVARYLAAVGDRHSCIELCRELVSTWTALLGPDHLQTLVANRRLAVALWAEGTYEEARELNRYTLARLRATVGDEHEETLALSGLVAADLRVAGQFREALDLDNGVFEHSARLYGRDDPATLTAGHNYSVSLRMAGRFAEAYEIDRRTSEIYLRSLGPASQLSLLAINNVARDLRELGRFADSVELQERTVAQYRQNYGDTHAHTMRAVKNLSVSCRKAGDRVRGLELAREVEVNYRVVLGDDHMDTLAARANIANDLRLTGDLDGARLASADALRAYRSVLGPAHPFTYIAAVNHGAALRATGEFAEARRLDEETVAGLAEALWPDHVWVEVARTNLATGLSASGDPAGAVALGRATAEALEARYGESHPHTLAALRNLSLDLEETGDQETAEDLRAKVRRRYRTTLGDHHPETRAALSGLRAECDLEPPPI